MKKRNLTKILIIVIALLLLVIGIAISTITKLEQDKAGLSSAVNSLTSEITTRKNKEGKLIQEKLAIEIENKQLRQAMPDLTKQIERTFDIKIKNLRAYMETRFRTSGSGQAKVDTLVKYDTITKKPTYGFAIATSDGYLDYIAEVYDSINTPYQYTYSDTIKSSFIVKGRWWEKKQMFHSSVLSNPNATVINSQGILVKEYSDKRWGIGPSVSYGFNSRLEPEITIGISVHYSLLKF